PYLSLSRLDKPIGSFLLFWPCAWSLTLAAQHTALPLPSLAYNLALFATGAFVMRGAGCTINDMWDSRLDAQVERTKTRPLAAKQITMLQAWSFLGLQLSAGLGVLLQLNNYSILLGASSLSLVIVYPLMKRITHWPQLVLGLAFNWGALLGWAALSPPPVWEAVLPLYAGAVCWTIVYDSVYAHQDKVDDIVAGVKSTALLFAEKTRPILTGFSVGFLALATKGHPCFLASLVPVAAHLAWQIGTTDLDNRADCWKKFVSNAWLGAMVWAGLMGDYLI
ncbi:4-hydroxybenzoate polyprenyl transferase, partial [Jaminaea rosea]